MSEVDELIGKKFNMLTVSKYVGRSGKNNRRYYECLCDCGNKTVVEGTNIKNGSVKSCGCLRNKIASENATKRNYKHGMADTRLQKIWSGMKIRCFDKNHVYYKRYGGRGISVCDEWMDFATFANWALNNGYSDLLTIDRIDNDGNYEPTNCRWVTQKKQNRNRLGNHNVSIGTETHCLSEWAEINNISYNTILSRLRYGWDDVSAVSVQTTIKHERKSS